MAGALGFITSNPATRGYDQQEERTARRRQRDQAYDTDVAIREGVDEMLRTGGGGEGLAAVSAAPPPVAAPSAPAASPVSPASVSQPPADLMPHFQAASAETGIPVDLLVAQARQESNWNPAAVGRAGEIGVTQVMPSTARQPGFGVAGVDPETLRDPRNNILFGARYLAGRGRAAGVTDWNDPAQVDRALAAYNGGGDPNYVQNVRRWLAGGGDTATAGGGGTVTTASAAQAPQQGGAAPTGGANPFGPVLQRLARTPGAGAAALQLLRAGEGETTRRQVAQARGDAQVAVQQARAQQQAERNIIYALGRGEVEVAQALAARAGVDLPPGLVQNSQARSLFARGANLASRYYRNDPQQAGRFQAAFIQSGGNIDAAVQAAGAPQGAPANWRIEMLRRDDQDFMAFVNPRTGEIRDATTGQQVAPGFGGAPAAPAAAPAAPAAPQAPQQPQGAAPAMPAPITRAPRAGSQARPSDRSVRYNYALQAGLTEQEAAALASGAAVTQQQRARAWQSFRSAAERDSLESDPAKREREVSQRVEAAMRAWDAEFGQSMLTPRGGGDAPTAPTAPTDQGRPPPQTIPPQIPQRPAAVPRGSQYSPSRQQWRDPSGRIYDRDGNPVS